MARAKRICGKTGCPHPASGRYCKTHNAEYEAKRGTKTQRGYGKDFQAERRAWIPKVLTGNVTCARCNQPIRPDAQWALDHSDDRLTLLGPSHKRCNDSAGGKASHALN